MKLLLDANLSWRLIEVLKAHFNEVMHVDQIDVKVPAQDEEIWQFAKMNNCIIVTNDQDFLDMVSVKGFPPKVILLKTGNQSNSFLGQLLINHVSDIQSLNDSPETGLLEIY
jgi:predicted nuclease of predicted toxin-antitoxin system